jgi:hypothetical protein
VLTKNNIVGIKHQFDDGDSIEVIQVKSRNEELHLVTYHIQQGPGIPRKLVMELNEFIDTYGHLFAVEED